MSLTTNGANVQLNWTLTTGTAPTRPTTWYVALHTADPTEVGTTAELTTGQASTYARQAITFGTSTTSSTSNTGTVSFSVGTVTGSVTVSHISIWNSSSATASTNVYYYGSLSVAKTLSTGDTLTFATGELIITQD